MALDRAMRQLMGVSRLAALPPCVRSVAALRHLGTAPVVEPEGWKDVDVIA